MTIDLDRYRIEPEAAVDLSKRATDDTQGLKKDDDGDAVEEQVDDNLDEADELQEKLYAEDKQSLLVVLQAMDAGGKDSTIRHVFGPLNPQGVNVASFKAPSSLERDHDYLWRIHQQTPRRGNIRVFNRSHYEDVLIVKVKGWASPEAIERRYGHINDFERMLTDEGTRIVKIMLHISKDYQAERFRRRLRRPDKHWKFNPDDLTERARWDDYMAAFETALERTSTDYAPWYVIPAEERWFRDLAVSQLLVDTLRDMDPQYPEPDFDPDEYAPEDIE